MSLPRPLCNEFLLGQGQCALAQGQYALAQKAAVNMQCGGAARGKDGFLHSLMLNTRHMALSAPSRCAPQAAESVAGALFTLRVIPSTSPRPTLSTVAEHISRGKFPRSDIISNSHDVS